MRNKIHFWILILGMLVSAVVTAGPAVEKDAHRNRFRQAASWDTTLVPEMAQPPARQEQVEVTGASYPGLDISLPGINERLAIAPHAFVVPTHDPRYYQEGGLVLNYLGITKPTGQIVSVGVPTSK